MSSSEVKDSIHKPQAQAEQKLNEKAKDMDLHDCYMFFRSYTAEDSITAFTVIKKCVEFGKELLPLDIADADEKKRIEAIHTAACEALVEAKPQKRTVKYEFQDFGSGNVIPVYQIAASDAGETQAREEELDKVLRGFIEQQYEQHIQELQDVDNQIFHMLVKHKVVKQRVRSYEELIDERIRMKMKERKHAIESGSRDANRRDDTDNVRSRKKRSAHNG